MKTIYCCLSVSLLFFALSLTQEHTGTVWWSLQQHCHESAASHDQAKGKPVQIQALFQHFYLRSKQEKSRDRS